MGVHWTKSSAGNQARAVVCPLSKIPGFLSGSCHHEFDRHKSNRIQANGIFIIPGLLVFGPSLSGLVGLRAFPFRACWSSGLPFLSGLITMGSIVINRTGFKRTAFSLLLDSVRTCCRPDLFVNMSSIVINRTKLDWMECSGVRYVLHEFLSNTRLTIGRFLCAHDPL